MSDQYRGDGIVSRAKGYGMYGVRVDGNDLFAVHEATRKAKEIALAENRPVLLETMSYRVGHHSTSDDSTRYRSAEEIKRWMEEDNPIERFQRYCEGKGWMDKEMVDQIMDEERMQVRTRTYRALEKGRGGLFKRDLSSAGFRQIIHANQALKSARYRRYPFCPRSA